MTRRTAASFALLALLTLSTAASACPMCKDSVSGDDNAIPTLAAPGGAMGGPSSGLPSGFNTSVYVMLTAFIGTLGLVGYTLIKGIRGSSTPPQPGFPVANPHPAGPANE